MKKIIYPATLLILLFWSCKNSDLKNTNTGTDNNEAPNLSIPENLKVYIQQNLTGFTIPLKEEYIKEWTSFDSSALLPFFCKSDYNGDGLLDYSLLLKKENKIYLFSFLSKENKYTVIPVDTLRCLEKGIDIIIVPAIKGEWKTVDETINIHNDGISIQVIEESLEWMYYLEKNKFRKVLFD